tara:strand:+ start:925 stop:1056 length:132 start_codon:yes stop_codon:yes gene_type:complete
MGVQQPLKHRDNNGNLTVYLQRDSTEYMIWLGLDKAGVGVVIF